MQNSHSSLIEAFHATPQLPGESKKSIKDFFTEKLMQHFKSIQKGFINLSDSKTGLITLEKLRQMFKAWSLQVDQSELQTLFDILDVNNDGKINYDDFQTCIGTDILPREKLYFRQEFIEKPKPIKCIYDGCWDQIAVSSRRYCPLHLALAKKKAEYIIKSLPQQLSIQWNQFLKAIAEEAGESNFNFFQGLRTLRPISFSSFLKILSKYGRALDCEESECLLEVYEIKEDIRSKKISLHFLNSLVPVKKEDYHFEESDSSEQDCLFPFGANLEQDRKGLVSKKKLSINEQQLAQIIKEENLLPQINVRLRKMDKDYSGLATVAEITTIFCDAYPILEDANFKNLLKKYQIEHNKMLIDYNRFVLALKKRIGGGDYNLRPRISIEFKSPTVKKASSPSLTPDEPKLSSSAIDKILGIKPQDFSKTLTTLSKKLSPRKREDQILNMPQNRPFTPEIVSPTEQKFIEMSPTPYIKPHFRRYQKAVLPRRSKSSIRIAKHLQRNKSAMGLSGQFSAVMSPSVHKSSEFVIKDYQGKISRLKEKILPQWREIYRQIKKTEANSLIHKNELQRIIQKQGIYLDRDQWRAVTQKCAARIVKDTKRDLISISDFIETLGLPRQYRCSPHSEKMLKRLIKMRSRSPQKNYEQNEQFDTEIIGRALTERLEYSNDPRIMKKKILLNWRSLYSLFKKHDGRTGLIPVEDFYKALRMFGIEILNEEALNFVEGKKINFRQFLKFHLGGQALDSSRRKT